MKIDYISDLHMDFWFKANASAKRFESFCNQTLFDKDWVYGEVLIVAGDLSHYNHQTKAFFEFLIETRYKKIFCVTGNHDLYLVSKGQKKKYNGISRNRTDELSAMFAESDSIHLLDGNVVEYNGVRFGGGMSWYDGVYCTKAEPFCNPISLWKRYSNDANLIYGYTDFYDILLEEKPKVQKVLNEGVDIMITHISPMPHASFVPEEYRYDPGTGFYTFDGENMLDETSASFWVSGHMHDSFEKEVYDTTLLRNALGYPGKESKGQRVKQFIFEH